jgi:hypothetical protein
MLHKFLQFLFIQNKVYVVQTKFIPHLISAVLYNGKWHWILTTDFTRKPRIKENIACIRITDICMRNRNIFRNTMQFTSLPVAVQCLNRIYMSYEHAYGAMCKDSRLRDSFMQHMSTGLKEKVGLLSCIYTNSYISTLYVIITRTVVSMQHFQIHIESISIRNTICSVLYLFSCLIFVDLQ